MISRSEPFCWFLWMAREFRIVYLKFQSYSKYTKLVDNERTTEATQVYKMVALY